MRPIFDEDAQLLLDDHRGIYIPRDFVEEFQFGPGFIEGVDPVDIETCKNPDHEWYWEAWQSICDAASYTQDGTTYRLWQDGALFGVPEECCFECTGENPCWEHADAIVEYRDALIALAVACDPYKQSDIWPDPIDWDARPLDDQADDVLAYAKSIVEQANGHDAIDDITDAIDTLTEIRNDVPLGWVS